MEDFLQELRDNHSDFSGKKLEEFLKEVPPLELLKQWLQEAVNKKCVEPNAMTISTAGNDLMPSSRVVYLKELIADGLVFYTNYNSKKGQDIQENPQVSASFFWPELARQIHVQGLVEKVAPEVSDAYFNSRPRDSKIGAWASQQSKIIANRSVLEEELKRVEASFENKEVSRPSFWGGYLIQPLSIELWQGRVSRLHDRICFFREDITAEQWTAVQKNP